MFHGIQNLEENILGHIILTHILSSFRYVEEEVTFWTIFQNDVNAVRVIHNFVHGNNVRVSGGEVVQTKFPVLESNLSLVQGGAIRIEFAECLDGISNARLDVDRQIDHAIGSGTDNIYQFQAISKEFP